MNQEIGCPEVKTHATGSDNGKDSAITVPEVKSLRLQAEWVMGLPVGSMASQDRITGLPSQLPNNPLNGVSGIRKRKEW